MSLSFCFIFGAIQPLHVELNIYKNVSFLTKKYQLNSSADISFYLPAQSNLENINIQTIHCKKDSLTLFSAQSYKSKAQKGLELKITALNNKITNLQMQNNLLKTLSLKEKPLQKAQDTLKFFSKNYIKNLQHISSLTKELKKAKRELKNIQSRTTKKYKRLKAHFTCRDKGKVTITYPQYNFKVSSFYEIQAHTKERKIDFVKKIKIIQKSGQNYKNIDIISHSNSYNQRVQPSPFYPKYLNIYKSKRVLYAKSTNALSNDKAMLKPIARMEYRQNLTTSAFIIKGINLPNNQEKIITLENKRYDISLQDDIDGYSSSLAYLRASFRSDKYYQNSRAYIYLNNNQIGSINLKRIKKDGKVNIYFGENQNIKVKKTLLKRYNESEFFGNKQINTQVWQYRITNQNRTIQKINLMERIPISQNEDIKVIPLFDTKKAKISKKGKVVWSFNLAPNKTKTIKFGYKTTKPKE